MEHPVLLGLGSNQTLLHNGQRFEPYHVLEKACRKLSAHIQTMRVSSVYRTKPMYVEDQEDFYNMAVFGLFEGEPKELLACTQTIEGYFGRNRSTEIKNGPRTLDIDIELFSDRIIHSPNLHIPHPLLCERAFILVPMLEVLPENAEIKVREFYTSCLNKIGSKDVVKFCEPFLI